MQQLALTSVQEAALNALGEALIDLGFNCSISFDPDFFDKPRYLFTARVPGIEAIEFVCRGDDTLAGAARNFIEEANIIIANPPVKTLDSAGEVKKAALDLVDEYRQAAVGDGMRALDELSDRVAALPVKSA